MPVTRTEVSPNPGIVEVDVGNAEHLFFRLSAGGPVPIFSFNSSVKGPLWEAPDFNGHPKKKYEWRHLKNPSDIQNFEDLDLQILFITNQRYTYFVELRDRNGQALRTVLEIKFSAAPTDRTSESFTVVIK